jgi:methyl-accepting chemotaxis protein
MRQHTYSVRNLIKVIGACVAVTTAVGAPLAYAVFAYIHKSDDLSFEARVSASRVSRYAYQHGPTWPFHHTRLAELIEYQVSESAMHRQRILTAERKLVLEEQDVIAAPIITRVAPIVVGEAVIGSLEIDASARPIIFNTLIIGFVSCLLGGGAYFAARILPLRALDRAMAEIENKVSEIESMKAAQEQSRAKALALRRLELLDLADQLEEQVKTIARAASVAAIHTDRLSKTVTSSISAANEQTQEVLQASRKGAAIVQSVSAATEKLSASFMTVDERIVTASAVAAKATNIVHHTNVTFEALSSSAGKVGDIIHVISELAKRTNLLSLNATIEAAHAGSAGLGFAVVATEVKELASQTAKATETIAAQIADIQASTTQAFLANREITDIVAEIHSISGEVARVIETQRNATGEIAGGAHDAATGANEVATGIEGVNKAIASTSDATQASTDAANSLRWHTEALVASLDQFLIKVRAA